MKKSSFIIVLSTIDSAKAAEKIASVLVKEKLAACVNITEKIRSVYSWKGKLSRDDEYLMILKTRSALYPRLEKRLKALHPYETPEIIAFSIEKGSGSYLDWISANTIAR